MIVRVSWMSVGTTAFGLSFMYSGSNWSPRNVMRRSRYSSPFSASATRTFCAQTEFTLWKSSIKGDGSSFGNDAAGIELGVRPVIDDVVAGLHRGRDAGRAVEHLHVARKVRKVGDTLSI